jgi:hypothetical protein
MFIFRPSNFRVIVLFPIVQFLSGVEAPFGLCLCLLEGRRPAPYRVAVVVSDGNGYFPDTGCITMSRCDVVFCLFVATASYQANDMTRLLLNIHVIADYRLGTKTNDVACFPTQSPFSVSNMSRGIEIRSVFVVWQGRCQTRDRDSFINIIIMVT